MQILLFIAQFLVGLVLIIKGADWMTDGASAIAKRFGISTLVIGMTIVAVGSSAPEFVVSVVSAIKGNTDMAIGNVLGSNIFNILAIMGATALIAPVTTSKGNIRYDLPFAVLSSFALFFAAFDGIFTSGTTSEISRSEGLLFLCIFAIFISYTFAISKKGVISPDNGGYSHITEDKVDTTENNGETTIHILPIPLWKSIILAIVGLACLIFGGDWLVDGASGIATTLGVSQSIIALTIVSIGTSAPELAASLMAAHKGDTAMALGNIVGSVVFNVFFILGTAATIYPLALGNISIIDITTLLIASGLLWIFCKSSSKLGKGEGAFLLLITVLYYVILILNE